MISLYYIMLCYILYIFSLTLLQNRVRAKVLRIRISKCAESEQSRGYILFFCNSMIRSTECVLILP